ncbi:SDR family NAD(P)-dependent oxidoreductase [Kitasatospora sp. NPDC094015]|uniref:SDR family NAD(P)-dependent oxidoreductase n=1 Tax=Kitasatospora sp. NPDC094015 TaxID=3155205 RepID=UPI003322FDDA
MYSTVTNTWLTTPPDTTYWYNNLRQPVLLTQALQHLATQGHTTYLETSPHPTLTPTIHETLDNATTIPTLTRNTGTHQLHQSLAQAWTHGLPVNWTHTLGEGPRTDLPTYPFQRERYWLAPAPAKLVAGAPADGFWEELAEQDGVALSAELRVSPEALGEVLPALAGWRSERSAQRTADGWRYRVGWHPLGLAPTEAPAGRWLVVLPQDGAGAELVEVLAAAGLAVAPVQVAGPGQGRESLAALLAGAVADGPVAGVLSLLAREERPHPELPELPGAVALTLALVQALGDAGIDAPLWCLLTGTAVLGAGERPAGAVPGPVQGAVAGLARTAALEHPDRWGGLVDLPEVLDERAARRLFAVLAGVRDEDQVAVRSTGVHGRRLLPAARRGRSGVDWAAAGTVLVTGGTGAVGRAVARRLVAEGARRLVLVGRRGAAAPGAAELVAELAGLGAEVTVAAGDLADRTVVAALLAEHRPGAVLHAAGVLADGMLAAQTPEQVAAVLRAKLTAARHLDELTADHALAAFVVFSSVMGVVGNAGQAGYAAANAALDALVAARRAAGRPGTSIAWGSWGGGGLLTEGVAERLRGRGLAAMDPGTAAGAVAGAVAEGDDLVVVADVDWHRLAEAGGVRAGALLSLLPGRQERAEEARPADREQDFAAELAGAPAAERLRTLTELVRGHAAAVLQHRDTGALTPARAFAELGFDSLTSVELRNRLNAATGLRLPATALFDHPTPLALAGRLLAELAPGAPAAGAVSSVGAADEPLAVVGMACRFPGGVTTPEQFWTLLAEGREAVGDWPADRGWDTEGLYDPDPDRPGTTYSRQGGFLADVAGFDAEFFGISPREALAMDPQQRLLLETAWEAVEASGQDPTALRGRRVGVFVGTNGQDYLAALDGAPGASEGHFLTGNTASVLSGRISYALGLEGPALTVDTACSSSLVALHLAAQALRRGECEQALAAGVTVMSTPKLLVEFSRQRGLAPDGRCKAFSADADGTGWGEGAGVLVVERLSDARRLGHRVLALVRGTAVNQDGASNGLTAPNGPSQQRVIRAALADAGLAPEQIDAVEAHGTGTRLGDPIEAQALQAVYGSGRPAERPLWLGSVKSNIGHTQAAAGVAGVIKTVLALRHGVLPRTLHVGEPNPHVDWSAGAVELLTQARPWPGGGEPRRAGVSSFGISGTNAHVIVEQAPEEPEQGAAEPDRLLPLLLSARDRAALAVLAERLGGYLDERPDADLAGLGRALAAGRASLEHRAAVTGSDRAELREGLRALAAGRTAAGVVTGTVVPAGRTVFLFPGQGSQRAGAGAGLYRDEPVFAQALDEVLSALAPHLDLELRELMFAAPGTEQARALERTRYTQPALFALQTALLRLLRHRGVVPGLLLGHSIGGLSAAHAAGVLDLADACALVAARGRLMDALPDGGAMVAVEAEEAELAAALAVPGVSLAAVNGPRACVLSGDEAAVLRAAEELRAAGRRVKRLAVSHAFHSARMDGMLAAFRAVAEGLSYREPRLPVLSDLTGGPAGAEELCSPEYWVRQVRGTVRFLDCLRGLPEADGHTFVELGAGGVLAALVPECRPATEPGAVVPLLREGRPEDRSLADALARLQVRGVPVTWTGDRRPGNAPELPTYPFRHRRYWPERPAVRTVADRLRHRVEWQPLVGPAQPGPLGRWLLAAPAGDPFAADCAQALAGHGAEVLTLAVPDTAGRAELAQLLAAPADGVLSLLTDPAQLLALVQAHGDADLGRPLWCATRGAVAAAGRPVVRPEAARLWGLGMVAALEQPRGWGGLVDLPDTLDEASGRGLCAVLAGPAGEDQVAVGPEGRYGRRLRSAPAPVRGGAGWRPRGTVLITGGTGGLGAQLARRLAATGAGHLVLTGRRGADAPGAAELAAELTGLGARVTVAACDVSDRAALERLLAGLDEPPRTVVHAAGLTSDTPLAELTAERLAAESAAKVAGAAHLDALLADAPLDAFVLFSSVSGVWGSGGQGSYAAANAYLDALAVHRRSRGLTATAVSWGPWAGAGMAAGATADRLRALGLPALSPRTALDALQQALDLDETHVVVTELDRERFGPAFESARPSALLSELLAAGPQGPDTPPERPAVDEQPGARLRGELAGLPAGSRMRRLVRLVRGAAAQVLGYRSPDELDPERPFREAGFDSLTAVELRNRLVAESGVALPVAAVFDHPTAAALAARLDEDLFGAGAAGPAVPSPAVAAAGPAEPLAIVGMACRLPGGVRSPEALWQLVADGTDAVGPLPTDRGWPLAELYSADRDAPGTFYAEAGGFLDGAGEFDAAFFGISPREALAMDPQQRLLLETAWEAVERAGIDPGSLRGRPGGVFVGLAAQGYGAGPQDPAADVEGHLLAGTVTSVASGRIAYTLGLEGPAVTVETACSSSLVALHLAGQSLRTGECAFALVGGAAVMAGPDAFVEFSRQRGLAADGRCRSFAEGADGTGWSEGVGVLLVETLAEARRLGHPVLAVVRGTAVNQDGASNGLTAPNGLAQQRVIRQALATAGLRADEVDLVEGHGTGTRLGDPIEAEALLATYGQDRPAGRPLWLGSLKSNLGHTQAAAGVAGVIKTVLALEHGVLPKTLHARQPSEQVDWGSGAVALLTEARDWPEAGRPRRAGVSSFGMSGTNAHAILEQAPDTDGEGTGEEGTGEEGTGGPADRLPWLLSARTPAALRRQAARLLERIDADPRWTADGIGRALATSRTAFAQRAAVLPADRAALRGALAALADGSPSAGVVEGRAGGGGTVFVFPGQGSQWPAMAAGLLAEEPIFAERIAACEAALAPHVDWSLTELLQNGDPLERVDVVQPALFAVMVSLAALWQHHGVHPDAVLGHSQGEIAAAVVAGALTLEDGAKVVALRSRALTRLEGAGGMVSVSATGERVAELLAPYGEALCVAAVNGPQAVVVAGVPQALAELLADCERAEIRARLIPVGYAAHSPQVALVRDQLLADLADVRARATQVPLYSTVTGGSIDGGQLTAEYWYRNLREPVAFDRATRVLLEGGHGLFVEVSPHPVLQAAVDATAQAAGRPVTAVGTLRRELDRPEQLLRALAEAWSAGAAVAWPVGAAAGAPVQLPTYPFEPERYWLPTPGRSGRPAAAASGAPAPTDLPDGGPATDPAAELAARLAPLDQGGRRMALLDLVAAHAAATLGHADPTAIRVDRAFAELGFDSMLAVRFRNRLSTATGLALPPTVIFDRPNPSALADLLDQELHPTPRGPAEQELDRLERALAGLDPDTPAAGEVGDRLAALLRTWRGRRATRPPVPDAPGPARTDPAPSDHTLSDPTAPAPTATDPIALDSATADELFDLLDNDFGMA